MNTKSASLLALALLAFGSSASAQTIYEQRSYVQPMTEVNPYAYGPVYVPNSYSYTYRYNDQPSVSGFVDRSVKTGIGVPAKAAKEAFKAVF